jgi:hypothetical protein
MWILLLVCGRGEILDLSLREDTTKKGPFSDQFNYSLKQSVAYFQSDGAAARFG